MNIGNIVEIDKITDIDELEKKIKESEILLAGVKFDGWIPLIISLGVVISMAVKIPKGEIYLVFTGVGLLYLGFNVWRVYNAITKQEEIETRLKKYRDKKAELETKKTR